MNWTDSTGRAQNYDELTQPPNTAWVCCMVFGAFKYVCYMQCTGQRATKLPVLFQP